MDLLARLQATAAEGTAILVSEQRASLALRIASRGVVLSRGRVAQIASSQELLNNPQLADLMAGG
jgi:branched-chain amino acid transport system ATP-binding protein